MTALYSAIGAIVAAGAIVIFARWRNQAPPFTPGVYTNTLPTSPYWLMTPGTWDEYAITPMTAKFDRVNGLITDVTRPAGALIDKERITNLAWHMPNDPAQVAIARVHTHGEPATAVDPTLAGVLLQRISSMGIGECGNVGAFDQDPPELQVSASPYPGEAISCTSNITTPTGAKFTFDTLYRTISVSDLDLVTSLVENPEHVGQETAYVYTFKDGRLENLVYGPISGDTVRGWVVQRTASGANPEAPL